MENCLFEKVNHPTKWAMSLGDLTLPEGSFPIPAVSFRFI
jgi:hypothetical protein